MFKTKTPEHTRRSLRFAAIAAFAVALAACGGGGSGNTVIDAPGKPLYTTLSPALTLDVGATTTFTAGGGGGGAKFTSYSATSSAPLVATVSNDGTQFTVKAIAAGTASITVSDSAGASVAVTLTVAQAVPAPNPVALFLNVPAAVTLSKGSSAQYAVAGGTAPYTIASSAPHVVSSSISGNTASVQAITSGTATIVVFDAKGASQKFSLTVDSEAAPSDPAAIPLYTTAPASLLLLKSHTADYVIAGGTAPYSATSAAPAQVGVTVTGNTMSVSAPAIGQAKVTIRDAVGAQVVITVGVYQGEAFALYTTAPNAISINVGSVSTFSVKGGTPPYTASTDKQAVATATVNDTTLTIRGIAGGTANIFVFDSTGVAVKIGSTVDATGIGPVPLFTTAASAITVMPTATATFTISGGMGPYTASSSNVSVATVDLTGKSFTIVGVASGSAQIVIRDAQGTLVTINVTIP